MVFRWLERRRARAALVGADADALMQEFGDQAYYEAKRRWRDEQRKAVLDGNRPRSHWAQVGELISKRTGRDFLNTATRYPDG